MTIAYQLILAISVLLLIWEMVTQKDSYVQIMSAVILIPFILRLFMIA